VKGEGEYEKKALPQDQAFSYKTARTRW